jgi:hypothetical protein
MVVTNLRGMKHQGKLLVIEYSKKIKGPRSNLGRIFGTRPYTTLLTIFVKSFRDENKI